MRNGETEERHSENDIHPTTPPGVSSPPIPHSQFFTLPCLRPLPPPGASTPEKDEDFVFWEVGTLLRRGKAVAPVLVDGATLPDESQLPEALRSLLAFQAPTPLSNTNWAVVVRQLLQQVERVLSSQPTQQIV